MPSTLLEVLAVAWSCEVVGILVAPAFSYWYHY